MIKGLGTDIVEIERVERALGRYGEAFLRKVFTWEEQEYCLRSRHPGPSLAVRFCAKEAAAKALGTGFGKEISFTDIAVTRDSLGKPSLVLSSRLQKQFNNPTLLVTLSHCKSYATATVLWIDNAQIKT